MRRWDVPMTVVEGITRLQLGFPFASGSETWKAAPPLNTL